MSPSLKECTMKFLIAPRMIAATALGCALFADTPPEKIVIV